jgi:hypothetical protein
VEKRVERQDFAYWQDRATSELQLAQRAASMETARPHYRMAIHYLDRAEELKRRLSWNIVGG